MIFVRANVRSCLKTLLKTQTKSISQLQPSSLIIENDCDDFAKCYPQLVRDLADTDLPQVNKRLMKIMECNVSNGIQNIGKAVPLFYRTLMEGTLTPSNLKLANILGWCLDLNQTFLLIQDDILDASDYRRGAKSWHTLEDVGMTALNDSLLLETATFRILKKYFSEHPYYAKLVECFHHITYLTAMGQTLEGVFKKGSASSFTMDKYEDLVKYKEEPYVFLFPVTLAMCLAKKYDQKTLAKLAPISRGMGLLIQSSNDFQDCFGDPAVTGKTCTDIKGNRFTWLITAALERASPAQRKALSENYGRDRPEAVATVKGVYEELNLERVFEDYEEEKLASMRDHIERIYEDFPHKLFLEYLIGVLGTKNWREKKWWYF